MFFIFEKKASAISVVYFLQATYCSISEGIHFLFEVAWFLLSIFQFQALLRQDSDGSFPNDGDNEDSTWSDSSSDSTNEVDRFFGSGLVAFGFTGCYLNIEGTLPALTFFFPLPKVVVRSSSLKWNSRTYILLFGFLHQKNLRLFSHEHASPH